MFKKLMFLLPVCACVAPGCVNTPDLSEATGTEQSNVMIKDVVLRVKCELSDAFDKKVEQREFLWLASWTAHADLTLTINDSAGISPTGSFIDPILGRTAHSTNGLTSALTSTFTLGASAGLNGSAVRTETVGFTVALDELKRWRKNLDRMEAKLPPDQRTCYLDGQTGLRGNLGLKEWVDSAFYPVTERELLAGVHSAPGGSRPSAASGPKSGAGLKAEATPADSVMIDTVMKWQPRIKDLSKSTAPYGAAVEAASQKIGAADNAIKNSIKEAKAFKAVLAPYLQERYAKVSDYIGVYKKSAENCSLFGSALDKAGTLASEILDARNNGSLNDLARSRYLDLEDLMTRRLELPSFEKDYSDCASRLTAQAEAAADLPKALPNQVDPPIDALSHSLQFVVNYNAGISPSWTLLQWKGPGGSSNRDLFGASGQRTHQLVLTMGPRSGAPAISNEALRLSTNQVIRSLAGQ